MPIRKLPRISRTYKHFNRYRHILTVLVKYGFGDLIDTLKIGQYLESGLKRIAPRLSKQFEHLSRAERFRLILEDLGPTFIKLGQIASTRPDLLPAAYIRELSKLQDDVPSFPFAQVREIIEQELGRPIDEVFLFIESKPLAAASIGQVHRARLATGEEVVVKVQRPAIRKTVETDLEILMHMAAIAERHVEEFRVHRPTRAIEEFSRSIDDELDYRVEMAHLERFAREFEQDETVHIPRVHHDCTSARLLTMEFIGGLRPLDIEALRAAGHDLKQLARRGAESIVRQVFEFGFFHADPHPGNLRVLPNDVICFLDFGMVGRLDLRSRESLADLIYGAVTRNPRRTTTALLSFMELVEDYEPDPRALERDIARMIDIHVVPALGQLDLGRLFEELIETVSRHHLCMPPNLLMMLKALATAEGLGVQLDPKLDMASITAPYIRDLRLARLGPKRVARDLGESAADLLALTREVPGGLRDLLRLAKRGSLRIGVEHRGQEQALETWRRIGNRLTYGLLSGAMLLSASLLLHGKAPPVWNDLSLIGLATLGVGVIMTTFLVFSIWRRGGL